MVSQTEIVKFAYLMIKHLGAAKAVEVATERVIEAEDTETLEMCRRIAAAVAELARDHPRRGEQIH